MTAQQKLETLEFPDSLVTSAGGKVRYKGLGNSCADASAYLSEYLHSFNLNTGFAERGGKNVLLVSPGKKIPFCLRILNYPDSAMTAVFGSDPKQPLELPVFEFFTTGIGHYGLNESKIISLRLCEVKELKQCVRLATKANAVFRSFFERRNAELTECQFWFSVADEKVVLQPLFHPFTLLVSLRESTGEELSRAGTGGRGSKRYADFFSNLLRI